MEKNDLILDSLRWAWQNIGESRHAELAKSSITQLSTIPRTGCEKTRSGRSSVVLTATMAHLHLLLRSVYFSVWPLEVRFFSADVYRVCEAWCERASGLLPDGIEVVVDLTPDVPDVPDEVGRLNRAVGTGIVDSL